MRPVGRQDLNDPPTAVGGIAYFSYGSDEVGMQSHFLRKAALSPDTTDYALAHRSASNSKVLIS